MLGQTRHILKPHDRHTKKFCHIYLTALQLFIMADYSQLEL